MTDKQENPYKATLLLPETAFPMRGDLPKREPDTLARWKDSRRARSSIGYPVSIISGNATTSAPAAAAR